MAGQTWWESVKLEGEALVDKLKELIHEGNSRRIRIVHQGRTVAEFPVTAGVVAAVLAPVAAAAGAVLALLKDCANRGGARIEGRRGGARHARIGLTAHTEGGVCCCPLLVRIAC